LNNKFASILVVLLALLLASAASASTITFNSASVYAYNFGVGVYQGTVGDANTNDNAVPASFVCDDFWTDISAGQSWQATVGNTDPAVGLLFSAPASEPFLEAHGPFTTQQDYDMVGYLANEIFANPTGPNVAAYSFAIWSVNDPAAYTAAQGVGGGFGSTVLSDMQAAYYATYNGHDPANLIVYTPTGCTGYNCDAQEFLAQAPVPELPTGAMLSGLALLGLAYSNARRKFARQ
jgi:hypothetical protein